MRPLPRGVLAALLSVAPAPAVHAQDYKKTVIYQVVTDRFYDGSTSNDNPSQSAGLYDPNGFAEEGSGDTTANWQAYWGGDLLGIQDKLSYIKGLNATATPCSKISHRPGDGR